MQPPCPGTAAPGRGAQSRLIRAASVPRLEAAVRPEDTHLRSPCRIQRRDPSPDVQGPSPSCVLSTSVTGGALNSPPSPSPPEQERESVPTRRGQGTKAGGGRSPAVHLGTPASPRSLSSTQRDRDSVRRAHGRARSGSADGITCSERGLVHRACAVTAAGPPSLGALGRRCLGRRVRQTLTTHAQMRGHRPSLLCHALTFANGGAESVHELRERLAGRGDVYGDARADSQQVDLPGVLPEPLQVLRQQAELLTLRPAFLLQLPNLALHGRRTDTRSGAGGRGHVCPCVCV